MITDADPLAPFDFALPQERIALRPARPRDAARLLTVQGDQPAGQGLGDRVVRDLPALLQPGDVLVVNATKVIPAALTGERAARTAGGGGGDAVAITINLAERLSADTWRVLARPGKRLAVGDAITFPGSDLAAHIEAKHEAGAVDLRFTAGGAELDAAVSAIGEPPLPPYIARRRGTDATDSADYQTVFARTPGSVAAPTAGLHFTPRLLQALKDREISLVEVTLHVGPGTFAPLTDAAMRAKRLHQEWCEVSENAAQRINAARVQGANIVAVGTTSVRTLESAVDDAGRVHAFHDPTDVFIQPGDRFRAVDRMLTNFHLPRSSLFMLVCAFAGRDVMQAAYAHAIGAGYRFYSYGDACLLSPNPTAVQSGGLG